MQPNMKKQYRAELSELRKAERFAIRVSNKSRTDTTRQITKLQRERDRALRGIMKDLAAIQRRRQILQGRLS